MTRRLSRATTAPCDDEAPVDDEARVERRSDGRRPVGRAPGTRGSPSVWNPRLKPPEHLDLGPVIRRDVAWVGGQHDQVRPRADRDVSPVGMAESLCHPRLAARRATPAEIRSAATSVRPPSMRRETATAAHRSGSTSLTGQSVPKLTSRRRPSVSRWGTARRFVQDRVAERSTPSGTHPNRPIGFEVRGDPTRARRP